MGADVIAWRRCPLQAELGQDGFLGKLKLRAYRQVFEEKIPREKWTETQIRVVVSGHEPRLLGHGDIVDELQSFERGIPECSGCASIARQIFDDVVSALPDGAGFYEPRGKTMALAELPEPLVHQWKEGRKKLRFDSAQLLRAATMPLASGPMVVAYARLWSELIELAEQRSERSRSLEEIRDIRDLLLATMVGALTESWEVVVSG